MVSRVLAVVMLASCTPAPPPAPPPAPVVAVAPPAKPAKLVEPTSPALPPCSYPHEPPTGLPALENPEEGPCRAVSPPLARSLATEVRKHWRTAHRRERIEIRGGCDRLGERITSLVVAAEMGSWSPVTLMSLEWQGDDYRLVLIEYTPRPPSNEIYPPYLRLHRSDRGPEGPPQIGVDPRLFVSGARLSAAAVAPLLTRVRAAVHLKIAVFPDQGDYLGLSHGAMTHHFHMRLADEQSRGMEGSYEAWATAGYGQGWTARMAIAERAVAKFLASPEIRSQLAPIGLDDPAVRTLFSYVFWQTMGRAALDLRLQILSMAAQLGEPQHVPGLVDILRSTALRDEERDQILAVIAGITGFDRRPVGGHKRTPDQVVAETRAACGRSP